MSSIRRVHHLDSIASTSIHPSFLSRSDTVATYFVPTYYLLYGYAVSSLSYGVRSTVELDGSGGEYTPLLLPTPGTRSASCM